MAITDDYLRIIEDNWKMTRPCITSIHYSFDSNGKSGLATRNYGYTLQT